MLDFSAAAPKTEEAHTEHKSTEMLYYDSLLPYLGGKKASSANAEMLDGVPIAHSLWCGDGHQHAQLKTSFDNEYRKL